MEVLKENSLKFDIIDLSIEFFKRDILVNFVVY